MKLYRRIALGFVGVTALVLVAVIYASLVRAEIRITPLEQEISSSFIVDVALRPIEETQVRGRVVSRDVEFSDTFTVSPAENTEPVEGKSSGAVTVYNRRSSAQPLVEKTRFLSSEGVLFRLDKGVTVPALGSIEARMTADASGAGGDVGPGRFTIPGLSESLQTLVYGETTEPMTGGLRYVQMLTQTDFDAALESLRQEAMASAEAALEEEVGVFEGRALMVEDLLTASDTEVGEETDRFGIKAEFRVVGVFFDEEELYRLAESSLYQDIGEGLRPVGVSSDALDFTIDRYSLEEETATLKVELTGSAIPSAAHRALSRGVFAGMTAQEVVAYFEENHLAKTVEVNIRPSWKNRIPRSPNKIKLLINE